MWRVLVVGMGLLVLAFLVQACGQARTRTRTGGYGLWDVPAGAALKRSFQAPVKTMDPAELGGAQEPKKAE